MRNPNANLRLEIAAQRGMQASDNTTIELRIEDRESGEMLAVINLTADEWVNATTGLSLTVEGFVSKHLDRVGKKMNVRQVAIPRAVVTSYKRDDAQVEASAWAQVDANHNETVEVRNTNAGWVAIYRSWS